MGPWEEVELAKVGRNPCGQGVATEKAELMEGRWETAREASNQDRSFLQYRLLVLFAALAQLILHLLHQGCQRS